MLELRSLALTVHLLKRRKRHYNRYSALKFWVRLVFGISLLCKGEFCNHGLTAVKRLSQLNKAYVLSVLFCHFEGDADESCITENRPCYDAQPYSCVYILSRRHSFTFLCKCNDHASPD